MTLISSIISKVAVRTQKRPTIQPPEKFCKRDNFNLLAANAEMYIKFFAPEDQESALLSSFDGEAQDIVREEGLRKSWVQEDTFHHLRSHLVGEENHVLLQFRFQTRVRLPREKLAEFVSELRLWAVEAFSDMAKTGW
ncbi:hypothetical protein D915_011201 [Fasciola hepatica]|uniref:Uncharacterized protein n=1 Tax=Fasciola hepatica TaxID=6192 RepID=A0A2H1BR70_FASHE|nr:hypothetical protein D915_011201 [Fasciola hepatica]